MKKILDLPYNDFKTEFFVLPKIDEFLRDNNVKYKEFLPDEHYFYEVLLFEIIDWDKDGKPDKKFGNSFRVLYYGIIEQWKDKIPEGFNDNFKHNKKDILGDRRQIVSETRNHPAFSIKYKILREN
ncbi:MAG: hypothetical protein Q7S74_05150 [Nanoarchaeota archaeon]|nr:hypothetical protein [Nanoarchaeota archaeon]